MNEVLETKNLVENGNLVVERDKNGRFIKGHSPSNTHREFRHKAAKIKDAFFQAFDQAGGIVGLVNWINKSNKNKTEFYRLLLSVLPKDIQIESENIETRLVILRNENKTEGVSGQVYIQSKPVSGPVVELGNGKNSGFNITSDALQRADSE